MKNTSFILLMLSLFVCFTACKKNKQSKPIDATVVETKQKYDDELKSVLINGDNIHYTDFGTGEPVVFVHGSLGDYRSWAAQVDTFATQHRVIAYSRRYAYPNKQVYNDSADYSVIRHANDLATLIKSLGIGPVHLVGHSWGAFTALKTTIDHPELVKSLMLGEPPVLSLIRNTKLGDSLLHDLEEYTFKPSSKAFLNNENTQGISLFIGGVMGDSLAYSKVPEFVRERWQKNVIELRGLVINRSFITVSPEDIQSLNPPVLIMKGEFSPAFLRVIADTLHGLLPNSKLFELPESSHGLQSSNPDVFNKTVLNFIDKN